MSVVAFRVCLFCVTLFCVTRTRPRFWGISDSAQQQQAQGDVQAAAMERRALLRRIISSTFSFCFHTEALQCGSN